MRRRKLTPLYLLPAATTGQIIADLCATKPTATVDTPQPAPKARKAQTTPCPLREIDGTVGDSVELA